jgi:hypothetical protein
MNKIKYKIDILNKLLMSGHKFNYDMNKIYYHIVIKYKDYRTIIPEWFHLLDYNMSVYNDKKID